MKAHADIDGLAFAAMKGMMLHEADEHGLAVPLNTEARVVVASEYGSFGITDRPGAGLRLEVEASTAENLFVLRDALVGHIEHYLPDVAAGIAWSDDVPTGARPPNFQFAEMRGIRQLSTDFLRVTLAPERMEGFHDGAIHFRFVLPSANDTSPDWPRLAPNGATRWPKGEKALHRPVYTVRAQRGDEIDVDVFLHESGRVREWVENVCAGDKVALIGPGGGGALDAPDGVILAGDETAFPAISRLIECLPPRTRGNAILMTQSGAQDYPLPTHSGMEFTWSTQDGFVDGVTSALARAPESFAWIAAEAAPVAAIRQSAPLAAIPKSRRYIATYWSVGKSAP